MKTVLSLCLSDDGKIFVGSGIGDPFGPRCHKGKVFSDTRSVKSRARLFKTNDVVS